MPSPYFFTDTEFPNILYGMCTLDCLVEGTADHIRLLLRSQLDEIHRITTHTDRELRIVLRMLLSVQQSISVENIYIQMMSALCCIAIQ